MTHLGEHVARRRGSDCPRGAEASQETTTRPKLRGKRGRNESWAKCRDPKNGGKRDSGRGNANAQWMDPLRTAVARRDGVQQLAGLALVP